MLVLPLLLGKAVALAITAASVDATGEDDDDDDVGGGGSADASATAAVATAAASTASNALTHKRVSKTDQNPLIRPPLFLSLSLSSLAVTLVSLDIDGSEAASSSSCGNQKSV